MMPVEPQPPALARWLLDLALPAGVEGLTILGDLHEEFREKAETRGLRSARRWYVAQALRLTMRLMVNRARPRRFASQTASDVRLALRSIRHQPFVSLVVVATAGLAIAANTALFSVFDGLMFRPLPYRESPAIVHLQVDPAGSAEANKEVRRASLERAKTTPSLLERANAVSDPNLFDWSGPAINDWQLRPARISPSVFTLLGVQPFIGRAFVEEDPTSRPSGILLGYQIWRTRFAGDRTIVDRLVEIPGTSEADKWRVVGVMPEGFDFPDGANFWIPTNRVFSPLVQPYARLAPGVTVQSLRAELPLVTVEPLREHIRPDGAYALSVLLVGTALLLVVAWVQIASLLFARATGRITEIGVRLALGGSRGRLVRLFAVEGAVLVACALGLAALATPTLTASIVRILPPEMTLGQHIDPDVRAFAFAALLSAIGLVLFTALPFDLVRRSSPLGLLRSGLVGDLRLSTTRLRLALFVGQLAVATSLVYLTGLTLRSFIAVSDVDLGYSTASLYAVRMPRGDWLAAANGRERLARHAALVDKTVEDLGGLPDVTHISGSHSWPMRPNGFSEVAITPAADLMAKPVIARFGVIAHGYPALLGVPVLEGSEPEVSALERVKNHADTAYVLVNRRLARELEPFGPVIGQVVRGPGFFQVAGVLPDVVVERLDRPVEPTMFVYLPTTGTVSIALLRLRPGVSAEQAGVTSILAHLWGEHAPQPIRVDDAVALAASDHRARTLLLTLIAALTVPLTMAGVAGALTYSTRQRTREIAIHLAIGASPGDVARSVSRQALVAAAIAIVVGLGGGMAAARFISASLFGVTVLDPVSVVTTSVLVVLVSWLSALVPAWRASRISPADALREA